MDGIGKALAFAVFEVFMQHLIAANIIVPQLRRDAHKVFIRVDLYGALVFIIQDGFNHVVRTATLILCYGSVQEGTLQEMNVSKFFAIF